MIHVVGIGLDGASGLSESVRQLIDRATLLVGSARHLDYFPKHPADRLLLGDFRTALEAICDRLNAKDESCIVVLTSGDPLFFGLGRLLLAELPPDHLTFHPHLSSVQLAFSRVKLPWQDAVVVSAHGRSLEELTRVLQQGSETIAVLTDSTNTPAAVAQLLKGLDLPIAYKVWVCENLGGSNEQVNCFSPEALAELDNRSFAPLNVVILHRSAEAQSFNPDSLPAFGLPDHLFLSFRDRPGLMTKREVRILILAELGLCPVHSPVVWDIGAGTGSVSIEVARLCPHSQVYAIEQTAAGISLIQQNAARFRVDVMPIHAKAPDRLNELPAPDRVFIGGSSGQLAEILQQCSQRLAPNGKIVLAIATLENLTLAMSWLQHHTNWNHRLLQINLARSTPIAAMTRFTPLNPVTLLTLEHRS